MKRLLPLALIVPLTLSATACGSSKKTATGSGSTATTAAPSGSATTASGSSTTMGNMPMADMKVGNPSAAVTLNESGSSLLYPFLQLLVDPLKAKYANVTLAPAAGGSGKGISDAIAGTTQLGGSDAYLSPAQISSNSGLLNIPIAVSSQAVNFNLSGVKDLKLSGDIIAKMFEGTIKTWNDPAIANINPGVTLPATAVVPVRRVDSSGDTFLFTSFLSATNDQWKNGPSLGTTVTWPAVSSEVTASGNPGMVQTCSTTPGCIAYVGISAENSAQSAGLGQAELENQGGKYVLPTSDTVQAAVAAGAGSIPDNLAAPLIYESGDNAYPIVNFEYIVVKNKQSSADLAMAIRDFLAFAIDPSGGSSTANLAKEQFQALPMSVLSKVQTAIASISS